MQSPLGAFDYASTNSRDLILSLRDGSARDGQSSGKQMRRAKLNRHIRSIIAKSPIIFLFCATRSVFSGLSRSRSGVDKFSYARARQSESRDPKPNKFAVT